MYNIILLYSPSQQIGKSTLAKELEKRGIVHVIDSFAGYIKELSYNIHKAVSDISITKDEFFQKKKDEKLLKRKIS